LVYGKISWKLHSAFCGKLSQKLTLQLWNAAKERVKVPLMEMRSANAPFYCPRRLLPMILDMKYGRSIMTTRLRDELLTFRGVYQIIFYRLNQEVGSLPYSGEVGFLILTPAPGEPFCCRKSLNEGDLLAEGEV